MSRLTRYGTAAVALYGVGGGLLHHIFSKSCTYFPEAQAFTGLGVSAIAAAALLSVMWFRELR